MNADTFDDDGYPTEDALDALDKFDGSPKALAAYLAAVMENYGAAGVEDFIDDFGNIPSYRLTLVTGGWSGCEEVIGRVSNTLFHFAFWESSWRGGQHTYVVPAKLWEEEGWWGKP